MPASPPKKILTAACACGGVELEAIGRPIASVVCYCDDCQEGARRIEALPNARAVLDPDGGSPYVLYRRDRIRCTKGEGLLQDHKLADRSATKRVVARCCKSAMYLGFDDSKHWVSMYRGRFRGELPPLQMRIQTRFRPAGGEVPPDVPSCPGFSLKLVARLLGARAAMLLPG